MSLSMASKPSFYISDGPMSFVFTGNQPASPTPTVPDNSDEELDDATEPEADYEDTEVDDEDDDDEDEEMDDDVAAAHEALEQLGLSDTEMADDSDADSNPPPDPSESEEVSPESGSEASWNDAPSPLSEEDDGEPLPPPLHTSIPPSTKLGYRA
ncbi:Protein of unknown function [Pyronema omphalodes CBS 100304]|uniref:Uncharacterized protein n=1 Tax=Pyronema omphalodes (strain CBS 100304) TaxID=1076935 RepID=U4LMT7_PYROM|nr:Protein of unknown function [Pyronema omphalodes CBS 100304]